MYIAKGEKFHFAEANCCKEEKASVVSVKNLLPLTQDINLAVDYGCAEAVFGVLHWRAFCPSILAWVVAKRSVT